MKAQKLGKDALVNLLGEMSGVGHSESESERLLLVFCLNCPDPVAAMDVVLDAPRGTADVEIVEQALSLPGREVSKVSQAELSLDHPLRRWILES